ncbi:TetR family transcriptional regulator [Nocardiopsis sp. CNT-189]|uniref:TetR/AcrR family transcriptional regulator n=1 Tax=Nocardiopsis oceanisediminis TaxID=2816862 RepID=UPI003B39D971
MGDDADRGERSQAVPDRLLAEATRMFAERGFERTSVQELVGAAGVTKGAMYHYFDSKDDLLYAIFQRLLAMQRERLDGYAKAPGPVADRLRAAAADLVRTSIENTDEAVIVSRSLHMLSPERQRAIRAERRDYQERFLAMVEEGRREGVFRSEVPLNIVATQFFGAVHHLGMWYRRGGGLGGAELGDHFAGLLMSGLLARG